MPHPGTGIKWDEELPRDDDPRHYGDDEIRDLRKGINLRVQKEHEILAGASSTEAEGGEHKKGSAKAYYTSTAPTKRPDTSTPFTSDDEGRLWVDTTDSGYSLKVRTDSAFKKVYGHRPYIKLHEAKTDGPVIGPEKDEWTKRAVTEALDEDGLCSVDGANVITLAPGAYECLISCPAFKVGSHKARLRYTGDPESTLLVGTTEFSRDTGTSATQTSSIIRGRFTLAEQSTLVIQHIVENKVTPNGFGVQFGGGDDDEEKDVYTVAEFWRVGV